MISYIDILQDNSDYYLEVPKDPKLNLSALDAAQHTINHIVKNYPAPYTLCLSGGVDSQAMLYAWIKSGQEFKTFSAVYNDNLNYHDLENLIQYSTIYNKPIFFRNFNIVNFLLEEHQYYANEYRCGSPHMCVFMKFIELINEGTVIFSGQCKGPGSTKFIDKNNFSIYRYAKKTERSVVPWFFSETIEIYFSWSFPPNPGYDPYIYKCNTYTQNGYHIIPQHCKYTGFEQVKDFFDKNYSSLVQPKDKLVRNMHQSSLRTFDVLFRNKYEAKFDSDKYTVKVNI